METQQLSTRAALHPANLVPGAVLLRQPQTNLERPVSELSVIPASDAQPHNPGIALCLAHGLLKRWNTYLEQYRQIQRGRSVQAVHQLRVASRRLMAHCDLVRAALHCPCADRARRFLKRTLKSLSGLRDLQVQKIFVESHLPHFPELVLVRDYLERRERRLDKTVAVELRAFSLGRLDRSVRAVLQDLAGDAAKAGDGDWLFGSVACIASDAYMDVVHRRRAINLKDLRTIHRTRVKFKRFRYIMEALSPQITGFDLRRLRLLSGYQRKMGAIQDLEVSLEYIEGFIRKHRAAAEILRPFTRYLRRRRARALSSFARSADAVFGFWPASLPRPVDQLRLSNNTA